MEIQLLPVAVGACVGVLVAEVHHVAQAVTEHALRDPDAHVGADAPEDDADLVFGPSPDGKAAQEDEAPPVLDLVEPRSDVSGNLGHIEVAALDVVQSQAFGPNPRQGALEGLDVAGGEVDREIVEGVEVAAAPRACVFDRSATDVHHVEIEPCCRPVADRILSIGTGSTTAPEREAAPTRAEFPRWKEMNMSRLGKKIRGTMTALAAATLTLGSAGAAAEPMGELRLLTWTKAQFPIQYEMAIVLAEAWSELGIESKIDPVNFPNPMIERIFNTHDFDAAVIAFTPQLQRLDPDFYTYNTFHSDRAVAGGWNFSGVMDPGLDELLVAQRQEYDFEARAGLVSQIQKQLYDANAWIPIVNADVLQVFNKANFRDPVIPKVSGFNDVVAFFTLKPTGERDVVRWATEITDLKTINPVLASESSQVRLVYLIYDTLMRIGPQGEPQFWAATALDAVDDTTLDATIREGMTFHDGNPVTAEDVAFTFNYMKEHKAAYYNATLGQLESATATGPNTVRFKLANPFAPFTTQTLAMVPIVPKHIWEGVEDPTTFENVPAVGSGTYRFGHWKKAQEFKVERFDGHFQPADNAGLLVIFYGTSEAAYTALIKQEADVLDSIPAPPDPGTRSHRLPAVRLRAEQRLGHPRRQRAQRALRRPGAADGAEPRHPAPAHAQRVLRGLREHRRIGDCPRERILARREREALRLRYRESETGPRGRGLHLGFGRTAPASGVKRQRGDPERTSGSGGVDGAPPPPALIARPERFRNPGPGQ